MGETTYGARPTCRSIQDLGSLEKGEVEYLYEEIRLSIPEAVWSSLRQMGRRTRPSMAVESKQAWVSCKTCGGRGEHPRFSRTVGTIHASSAHSCVTALYFDLLADEECRKKVEPDLLLTFKIGTAVHDMIQAALHLKFGDKFLSEVQVDIPDAFIVNSHADGVLDLGFCRVLVEIKTISAKGYERLRSPSKDHKLQTALYAKGLDLPFICYLYVSKEFPHGIKAYVRSYDHRIYEDWWLTKGLVVETALEADKPPRPDVPPSTCSRCGHQWRCPFGIPNPRHRG